MLERDAAGHANWEFSQTPPAVPAAQPDKGAAALTSLHIGHLRIDKGRIVYRDAGGMQETFDLDSVTVDADTRVAPIALTVAGQWDGHRVELSGVLGSLNELLGWAKPPVKPYPVQLKLVLPGVVAVTEGTLGGPVSTGDPQLDVKLTTNVTDLVQAGHLLNYELPDLGVARLAMTIEGTLQNPSFKDIDAVVGRKDAPTISVKGEIVQPLAMRGVSLQITTALDTLASLNKPFGLAFPALGPAQIIGRLSEVPGGWRVSDMKLSVGASDVGGDVTVWPMAVPLKVEAHLQSSSVRLDDWKKSGKEESSPKEARVFSDKPLPLSWMDQAEGTVSWKIDHLTDSALVLGNIALDTALTRNQMTLGGSVGKIAGGAAKLSLVIQKPVVKASAKNVSSQKASSQKTPPDQKPSPAFTLEADATHVIIGDLLKDLGTSATMQNGPADLKIRLKGSGASLHAVMSKLNGDTLVIVGQGRLEGTYADLLAADLVSQLAPWGDAVKDTNMRCLVSRFAINDGTARSEALLFDTEHMTVIGQGSVNLGTEALDLTLTPHSKEASLISLAIPLDVHGTLADPVIMPNKGAIVKGVASTVGGLALGPLGAIIPMLSAGSSEDENPCVAAARKAPSRSSVKGAAAKPSSVKPTDDSPLGIIEGLFGD